MLCSVMLSASTEALSRPQVQSDDFLSILISCRYDIIFIYDRDAHEMH